MGGGDGEGKKGWSDHVKPFHEPIPPMHEEDGEMGRRWSKKNILIRLEKYLFLVFYLFKFVLNFKL